VMYEMIQFQKVFIHGMSDSSLPYWILFCIP